MHEQPYHIFGKDSVAGIGAIFVGHRNLPRSLAARGEFYLRAFRKILGEDLMKDVRIIEPALLVEDTRELDRGGRAILLRAWPPAQTDCDRTAYDPETPP